MDFCPPSAWNGSWDDAQNNPSAAGAINAMTCVIVAASALGARGRTTCKRQVSGSNPLTGSRSDGAGWWQQLEADAEATNGADASEHQAASNTSDSRPPQPILDMNPPSAPRPEPRTSPENEPEQNDRATRLDGLLAKADQAARRIAVQQAERHASNDYAARMELEAQIQTQAEPEHQARARDEAELELLRRADRRGWPPGWRSSGARASVRRVDSDHRAVDCRVRG